MRVSLALFTFSLDPPLQVTVYLDSGTGHMAQDHKRGRLTRGRDVAGSRQPHTQVAAGRAARASPEFGLLGTARSGAADRQPLPTAYGR